VGKSRRQRSKKTKQSKMTKKGGSSKGKIYGAGTVKRSRN
jgi:hypothetical protein